MTSLPSGRDAVGRSYRSMSSAQSSRLARTGVKGMLSASGERSGAASSTSSVATVTP